jgi:hypothetical protein
MAPEPVHDRLDIGASFVGLCVHSSPPVHALRDTLAA